MCEVSKYVTAKVKLIVGDQPERSALCILITLYSNSISVIDFGFKKLHRLYYM